MPTEVRPKSKHPSMMKKARGGDRFEALESESLLPPALRSHTTMFNIFFIKTLNQQFRFRCWNQLRHFFHKSTDGCVYHSNEICKHLSIWSYIELILCVLSHFMLFCIVYMCRVYVPSSVTVTQTWLLPCYRVIFYIKLLCCACWRTSYQFRVITIGKFGNFVGHDCMIFLDKSNVNLSCYLPIT